MYIFKRRANMLHALPSLYRAAAGETRPQEPLPRHACGSSLGCRSEHGGGPRQGPRPGEAGRFRQVRWCDRGGSKQGGDRAVVSAAAAAAAAAEKQRSRSSSRQRGCVVAILNFLLRTPLSVLCYREGCFVCFFQGRGSEASDQGFNRDIPVF